MHWIICLLAALIVVGCSRPPAEQPGSSPSALSEVPAVRLNYRYEADVPPPDPPKDVAGEERNAAVQNNFDQTRQQEVLDRTISAPDAKRVLAIYHKSGDLSYEFRLDMYTADGQLLKKVTADAMAVLFPDTIRWSPDSSTVAFVARVRGISTEAPAASSANDSGAVVTPSPATDPETAPATGDPEANANVGLSQAPTPAAPTGVLTFRTEQIYISNADGDGTKPITQNEGLIYFYFVWSPDSSMLTALAAKSTEFKYLEDRAELAGEQFVPVGRPRVIEKNGRERRLDDALTAAQPVWSPDSTKVACAYEHQIRIYDAVGTHPTQAAIPLRNHLLLSSQAYDRDQASKLNAENIETDTNTNGGNVNANTNSTAGPTTLPYESPVSFNPIVAMNWSSVDILYFQTAYIKRMKNEADSVTSFPRWHRLVLTPQAVR